jgi:hypothetical protein
LYLAFKASTSKSLLVMWLTLARMPSLFEALILVLLLL